MLLLATGFLLLSLYLFLFRQRTRAGMWCLFAGAFLLRFWMAGLDPYLHDWDERFHAIVAKNLLENPLLPVLRTQPVLPYDYTAWCCNYVWLHKQPLFLWQMALSMKIFGADLWSLRLPSVLMGALLVFPVARMGTLLKDSKTGFYAAFIYAGAFHQLEMIAGLQSMEHNDMAFLFYVTLSLWAYFEWAEHKSSWQWAVAVGVFAGAAVLCKWLAGLLVFSGWGLHWLFSRSDERWKEFRALALSLAVAIAVFLPWQIYTQMAFPAEAAHERAFNTRHIFEVVEGHGAKWDYYFNYFKYHYGRGSWIAALVGLLLIAFTLDTPRYRNAILIWIAVVYGFFSFVAQTKLPSYVYFIAPLIYLLFGIALRSAEVFFLARLSGQMRPLVLSALLCGAFYLTLQPQKIDRNHLHLPGAAEQHQRQRKMDNTRIYRKIDTLVPPGYFVFNCPSFEDTEAMFFSGRQAYQWTPNEADFQHLKSQGIKMAVFHHPDGMQAPGYMRDDPEVLVIPEKLVLQ